MDETADHKPLMDDSPSQNTNNLSDDCEDSELTLPPYPDDLPSPLDEEVSQMSSPIEEAQDADNKKEGDPSISQKSASTNGSACENGTLKEVKTVNPADVTVVKENLAKGADMPSNSKDVSPHDLKENTINPTGSILDDQSMNMAEPSSSAEQRSERRVDNNTPINETTKEDVGIDNYMAHTKTSPPNGQPLTLQNNSFKDKEEKESNIEQKPGLGSVSTNSSPETKDSPEDKWEPKTDARNSTSSDISFPEHKPDTSTLPASQPEAMSKSRESQPSNVVLRQNYVLPREQSSQASVLTSSVEASNELWPPVSNIEDIDMDLTAHLGELDKFCQEYGNDKNGNQKTPPEKETLTSHPGKTVIEQKPELKPPENKLQALSQISQPAKLPKFQSMDKDYGAGSRHGSVDRTTQPVVAELCVPPPKGSQDEAPFTPYGSRDLSIPLHTSSYEKPDPPVQDMGQRRRERYAQSKGPFWKQSGDGNFAFRKVETPTTIDSLHEEPYEKELQLHKSESVSESDKGQAEESKPMNDAAIIKNDFIIIKLGGDHDPNKEQKLAEIVNELKRLSSLDEVVVEGKNVNDDDSNSSIEIPKLPSPENRQSGHASSRTAPFQRTHSQNRGESKFVNASARIISDNRAHGQSPGSGFSPRTRVGNTAPFRRGLSYQHDNRAQDRYDTRNPNRPAAASSLSNLASHGTPGQKNGQNGPIDFNAQYAIKRNGQNSGDHTPTNDNGTDIPKTKANNKGAPYERFDFKNNRPRSVEMPSGQKIMKFLNLNNGSEPEPEAKLIATPSETDSPELLRHPQQGDNQDKETPTSPNMGQTNDAFENESQLSGDDLVMELLRLSGKNFGAMSISTVDSAEESETPGDETTPLCSNQHRRQRSITFFDEITKEKDADLDSISEEADETCPLRGSVVPPDIVFSEEKTTDDEGQGGDDFNNEEYDNLSLEFVVPGYKKHIRLHRQTFIIFVLKYSIFLFSFIFWAASLSGVGFGTWMLTRKTVVFDNASDVMLDPHVLLCLVGGIIFLVAFLGSIGALRENILLLKMFHISLTAVLALEALLSVLIFLFYAVPDFRRAAKVGPEEILKRAVLRYFDDAAMQEWIDNLQKEFKCCGVSLRDNGYLDWTENQYFNCSDSNPSVYRCSVPLSCCIFERGDYINYACGIGIINRDIHFVRRYIHTKGCMQSFGEWLGDNTSLIAYVGLGFFIPQFLGVVAARYFITNLKKQEKNSAFGEYDDDDYYDDEEEVDSGNVEEAAPNVVTSSPVSIPAALL